MRVHKQGLLSVGQDVSAKVHKYGTFLCFFNHDYIFHFLQAGIVDGIHPSTLFPLKIRLYHEFISLVQMETAEKDVIKDPFYSLHVFGACILGSLCLTPDAYYRIIVFRDF